MRDVAQKSLIVAEVSSPSVESRDRRSEHAAVFVHDVLRAAEEVPTRTLSAMPAEADRVRRADPRNAAIAQGSGKFTAERSIAAPVATGGFRRFDKAGRG
jgi:hypothetical protein